MPQLEVLLPVHNEAASIEAVIREIYEEIASRVQLCFIVCEDGSQDGTREILNSLSHEIPMRLLTSAHRKGYSSAVTDGMRTLQAPYILCLDADGQCDPADFWALWELRTRYDLVIGWRVERQDAPLRKALSRGFYHLYQCFFHVPVHDPSCPFVIASREAVLAIRDELGAMQEGFWWEFVARGVRNGLSVHEVPVKHRPRAAGRTQVYRLGKLPGIARSHLCALLTIRNTTPRRVAGAGKR